jgi:PGF-CTERM protein
MENNPTRAVLLAVAVLLSSVTAGVVVGTGTTGDLGDAAAIDATPSDPNEAESTHAIVVPLGSAAETPGSPFRDVVVDYTVGAPTADVSNVGAGTVERIGIDRNGDDPGTRIDVNATITSVSGKKDGAAVRIATAGNHTLRQGDEVVVVLRPVQNPQNAGTAKASVTINSQNAADVANGTVTYEYNDASIRFDNRTTTGETVTLSSVTLSEGGFVAIQNKSGANPGAIRGHSAYLSAGTHTDVTIQLDAPVETDRELVAQAYTDSNADLRFEFGASGGEVDDPYLNRDGNVMGVDEATVEHTSDGDTSSTPTPTATPTDDDGDGETTATPTPTATPTDDDGGMDDGGGGMTATPTPTRTDDGDSTSDGDVVDDGSWEDGTLITPAPTPTPTPTDDDRAGMSTPTDSPTATPTDSPTAGEGPQTTSPGEDAETPGDDTETSGQPGFGAVAALVALAGAALLARRAA